MLTAVHSTNFSETTTRMRNELAVMRALATALESLPDDRARVRAIRWVIEAFNLELDQQDNTTSEPPVVAARGTAARSSDPGLTMEGIDEMFPGPKRLPAGSPTNQATADRGDEPQPQTKSDDDRNQGVKSMIDGFVSDFQKLAQDWQD